MVRKKSKASAQAKAPPQAKGPRVADWKSFAVNRDSDAKTAWRHRLAPDGMFDVFELSPAAD